MQRCVVTVSGRQAALRFAVAHKARPCTPSRPAARDGHRPAWRAAALPEQAALDTRLSELMGLAPMEEEQKAAVELIASTLGVTFGEAKQMVYKKKGLVSMEAAELQDKLQTIADKVDVPLDTAKRMAAIQPGLLFDTERQAETLNAGIKAICYDLNAPREEVVRLIMENKSVLHGQQMHLSVADIAHLAMSREPVRRVVD